MRVAVGAVLQDVHDMDQAWELGDGICLQRYGAQCSIYYYLYSLYLEDERLPHWGGD
jgi:hypothetical protein